MSVPNEPDSSLAMHSWNLTPQQAIEVQKQLAVQTVRTGNPEGVQRVAGVDVSFNPREPKALVHAVVVVLSYPGLEVVDRQAVSAAVDFPYIPGLLSFREAPPILAAIGQLSQKPDLVIVDGHGYAHPRRLGIASHLGLFLDLPTIGCAKSILVGRADGDLAEAAGSLTDLLWRGEVVGRAVRTRSRVQPVYVSPGHRLGLDSAVEWVLRCCRGYRLPEPTRQAHNYSNLVRKARQPISLNGLSGAK
ncbi:endonuclease V [Gloeobacter violaceus PCC 7421]|uniref:Endonuclease V n=2 Tax=Gloeobacter violaceus TaxID=33072 RepID=NFI_GLOVI|nr:RecName: Full=Endonuclease V; AltName: Full=Deoxyinosine 3'endonuclease; AltName: Full=Deoxyribonuclease V; Short=DNase V [Gloeobacter violaceus PCC 7421]BAC92184.1 endonuclease V [Gloeobacter violaceus PCC 7421]